MSSRSRVIADVLTKAILEHRLVPGAKLGERELSEIFEVSRIVVRQALIRLAADGLVSIVRNRGAFVAKPSMQEAYELYDALTLIEQGVAAQLAERMGPRDWAALRRQVEQTRQAMDSGNHALADTLGPDFHTQLIRASRNKVVQDIHAQIVRRTMLLRSLYFNHFDYCSLLDDHSKLLDLLERSASSKPWTCSTRITGRWCAASSWTIRYSRDQPARSAGALSGERQADGECRLAGSTKCGGR